MCLIGRVSIFLLKICCQLNINISVCVFVASYTKWQKEISKFLKIRFVILWQLSVCT